MLDSGGVDGTVTCAVDESGGSVEDLMTGHLWVVVAAVFLLCKSFIVILNFF